MCVAESKRIQTQQLNNNATTPFYAQNGICALRKWERDRSNQKEEKDKDKCS